MYDNKKFNLHRDKMKLVLSCERNICSNIMDSRKHHNPTTDVILCSNGNLSLLDNLMANP